MCKEMNAPVLPESKKVNATVINTLSLTGEYDFVFDDEFAEAVQMNRREHACLCRLSKPMIHFCCPGLFLFIHIKDTPVITAESVCRMS